MNRMIDGQEKDRSAPENIAWRNRYVRVWYVFLCHHCTLGDKTSSCKTQTCRLQTTCRRIFLTLKHRFTYKESKDKAPT